MIGALTGFQLSSWQRATTDTEVLQLPLKDSKPVVPKVKVNNFQIVINTSFTDFFFKTCT